MFRMFRWWRSHFFPGFSQVFPRFRPPTPPVLLQPCQALCLALLLLLQRAQGLWDAQQLGVAVHDLPENPWFQDEWWNPLCWYVFFFLSEAISSYLKLSEAIWSYLKLSESIWSYLKLSEAIYLSIYLSIYQSINLSIYQSNYQGINLSIYQYINLSIYQSIYQSINLSIYQYINLSINQSIYLSIYIYIYVILAYVVSLFVIS